LATSQHRALTKVLRRGVQDRFS